MILTTPIKQPYTTTKHNNKGYIFTLYLFMFLCVVGNCLLFYCSCTGNCENCCGINGNASVSCGIKDKSDNKIVDDSENKLEEVDISNDGIIDDIQIVNSEFVKQKLGNVLIKKLEYEKDDYKELGNKFIKEIDKKGETYLSAYVEVGDNGTVKLRCLIKCKNANSIYNSACHGLFDGSEATKIEILSCGSEIKNMDHMFYRCFSLKELDLSKFNTDKVTNMSWMFYKCSSLTSLDLSNFNTSNVKYMNHMFYNCFKAGDTATLICTASTIKKITDNGDSYLTITNDNKNNDEIKKTINTVENQDKVYTCSVKRGGNNPEITKIEEYQQQ